MNQLSTIPFYDISMLPDEQIGMHVQPTWELSYIEKGTGVRTIGDSTEAITAGEVVLIPPEIPHCWKFDDNSPKSDGNIRSISIMFPINILNGLSSLFLEMEEPINNIFKLSEAITYAEPLRSQLSKLLLSIHQLKPVTRLPKIVELIILLSNTGLSRSAGKNNNLSPLERKLNRLNIYCKCNFNKNISLEATALHMRMNKSSFCVFIKRHTGMTFTEYLNDIRLNKVVEMLRNKDLPISDIAYESGFACIPYFNRVFRNKFGCSPKEYQLKNTP